MDLLGSAHGSGNGNLLHTAVRARPDSPAGGSSRGEEERTEFRMVAEGQGLAGQPFFGRCAEEGLVKNFMAHYLRQRMRACAGWLVVMG